MRPTVTLCMIVKNETHVILRCLESVYKYIDRYDTKGTPRADLFKVLHYTILLINHLNLVENK